MSYQKWLKCFILTELNHTTPKTFDKMHFFSILNKTNFIFHTHLDLLEACLQVIRQWYTILNLLVHRKNVDFFHFDYSFNLKLTRTLTTKEIKI